MNKQERNSCHQCSQKFLGTNWQEIHTTADNKKKILCSTCWDKKKRDFKRKG